MSRAEDEALKAYPPKMEYSSMIGVALNNKVDANIKLRDAYVKGYEQALVDMAWIALGEKVKKGEYSIDNLTKAMEEFDISHLINAINANFKSLSEKKNKI